MMMRMKIFFTEMEIICTKAMMMKKKIPLKMMILITNQTKSKAITKMRKKSQSKMYMNPKKKLKTLLKKIKKHRNTIIM